MASLLDQLLGNGGMQSDPNMAQKILSARFQPSQDDVAQSIFRNTTGFNANAAYTPVSPEQVMGDNQMAMVKPYALMQEAQGRGLQNNITAQTGLPIAQADLQQKLMANQIQQQTGMQGAQADIANKNAMAGYYNSALQRDIAEKAFAYANDPQMAQAKAMAAYMQSLQGGGQPQTVMQDGSIPAVNASALQPSSGIQVSGNNPNPPSPQDLSQALQSNAVPVQQSGFNPMGALLAKQLGMTDMQIGPNGQPMPIPGSMKIENGSVISFDQNGKPQSNIPVNPRAQGLFEQKLQDINDNLDKLHAIGGTVEENPQKGWLTDIPLAGGFLQNKATQMAASTGGKYMPSGQDILQGTEAQTLRDNINADVKQALPLYMQAFGITPGMERAQSAQQMLQDAIGGSLSKSLQHTKSNLRNLSQTAGNGQLSRNLDALDSARSAIAAGAPRDAVIQRLQGAGINPAGL